MKELYVTHLTFTLGYSNPQRDLKERMSKILKGFKLKLQYYIQEESNYEYKIKQSN